jgi:hypothetical protein
MPIHGIYTNGAVTIRVNKVDGRISYQSETQAGFLQLAGSSFRAIKYWSGFAGGFCSGTLKCSANKPPEIFAFLLL